MSRNGDARRSHLESRQILSFQMEFLYCHIWQALLQPNLAHDHSYRPRAYGILARSPREGAHRPTLLKQLIEKRVPETCSLRSDRLIYYIGFLYDTGLDRECPLAQSALWVEMMLVEHCSQPLWGILVSSACSSDLLE
jgi:hypothetical protein